MKWDKLSVSFVGIYTYSIEQIDSLNFLSGLKHLWEDFVAVKDLFYHEYSFKFYFATN